MVLASGIPLGVASFEGIAEDDILYVLIHISGGWLPADDAYYALNAGYLTPKEVRIKIRETTQDFEAYQLTPKMMDLIRKVGKIEHQPEFMRFRFMAGQRMDDTLINGKGVAYFDQALKGFERRQSWEILDLVRLIAVNGWSDRELN